MGDGVPTRLASDLAFHETLRLVLRCCSLQLQATRDRGFTRWKITAPGSRHPWQPLDLVCQGFAASSKGPYSSFRLLRDHLPEIEQLFASKSWIPPIRP